jgi:hypothetical protein
MPARRRQLPASFRQCLWSRVGRPHVESLGRLHRCRIGSALEGDARGITRGTLSDTIGLIGVARQFLTGGDLVDGSRYLLLTGRDPVDALPHCVEVAQYLVELLLIGAG